MRKRRNSCCGFSRGSCGVLEESIVPVSDGKGFRVFDILNMLNDDGNNDTRDFAMKEKSQRGAKKRVACSPASTSSLGRCFALLTSESSKCGSSERSSTSSKGKEKSGSTAERSSASTNPSSVERTVCRKLFFQSNKAVASELSFGKQNSGNCTSVDTNNGSINAPETPSIQEESLPVQHMPNPSSTVFRSSSRKGDSPIYPARVVPDLPIDGVLSGAERYRRKSPKHLKPKKAKPSEGQGIMVSRSLSLSAGSVSDSDTSQVDNKTAPVNVRSPALEKTCKAANSVDQMTSAVDCNPLKSEDKQQSRETGESRAFLKKQKTASGLPALPSKDALNSGISGFLGFRKPCDEQLFNFGLGFGVVFMVTSSKKEIEKLRELQKETERLFKDLKEEVSRRNFSNDSSQIVQNGKDMLSEYHYAKREIEDTKDRMAFVSQSSSGRLESGISGNECNSSAQSIITTESTPELSGMAQLEAELEAELERMELNLTAERSCELETFSGSEIPGNIVYNDLNVSGIPGKKSNHDQEDGDRASYGVSPIELERRLHELLQKRQEDRIAELEADLKITEDELVDKEKELSWWKERVCQLLQGNDEAKTTPGDESTASMSTSRGSNKSLVFSYSCNGDDLIKEVENLKRSETLNCCKDIANASSRGTLDVREESSNPDSLLTDFKHLINFETKRKFANSPVQSETQTHTFGSNTSQNVEGTERKENALLCRRKKAACADNLQNYSTARELFIDMPSASKNIAFQQTKELIPNSVFNTPLRNVNVNMNSQISHQKNVQNTPEDKTYSAGLREPSPPLLNKIKHWEALSRGETSSTQSCDMDNDHRLATCHPSLVSVTDNNGAKCWETSVDHGKWKQGSFGCAEQDTVGINLESISDIKLHCSDCRVSL